MFVLGLAGIFWLTARSGVPLCPMAGVLGIPCPGCGLTRATLALASGDLELAFAFHPLVFVLAPLLILAVGSATWSYVRGPNIRRSPNLWLASPSATALASLLLVATLSVWGARFAGYLGGPVPVVTLGQWQKNRAVSATLGSTSSSALPVKR